VSHISLARIVLSGLCATQGVATIMIDVNRTHATNPRWPAHARLHLVWHCSTVALLAVLELFLLWTLGPITRNRIYLVSLLAALSPIGFVIALLARGSFGGSLSDQDGIEPLPVRLLTKSWLTDLNLVAVIVALLLLAAIVQLA
jgi:hypothetical protein